MIDTSIARASRPRGEEPIEPIPLPRLPTLLPPAPGVVAPQPSRLEEAPSAVARPSAGPSASSPSERFLARQKKAGAAGGKSRSDAKRAAVRANLAKARASRWPNQPSAVGNTSSSGPQYATGGMVPGMVVVDGGGSAGTTGTRPITASIDSTGIGASESGGADVS
jgi:hypothetical protein